MYNLIAFPITKYEKIKVQRYSETAEILKYDEIRIIFEDGSKKYILYNNDFIYEALSVFERLLRKATNGELNIHESLLEKGIGFESNESFQNRPGLIMAEGKEGKFWVGDKYLLWDSMQYQTWIYNRNKNIVIEITPIYKWHFDEPENNSEFETYEEFCEKYETCFVKIIPKSIALQWLIQCQELLKKLI